jgi:hypothetical protein
MTTGYTFPPSIFEDITTTPPKPDLEKLKIFITENNLTLSDLSSLALSVGQLKNDLGFNLLDFKNAGYKSEQLINKFVLCKRDKSGDTWNDNKLKIVNKDTGITVLKTTLYINKNGGIWYYENNITLPAGRYIMTFSGGKREPLFAIVTNNRELKENSKEEISIISSNKKYDPNVIVSQGNDSLQEFTIPSLFTQAELIEAGFTTGAYRATIGAQTYTYNLGSQISYDGIYYGAPFTLYYGSPYTTFDPTKIDQLFYGETKIYYDNKLTQPIGHLLFSGSCSKDEITGKFLHIKTVDLFVFNDTTKFGTITYVISEYLSYDVNGNRQFGTNNVEIKSGTGVYSYLRPYNNIYKSSDINYSNGIREIILPPYSIAETIPTPTFITTPYKYNLFQSLKTTYDTEILDKQQRYVLYGPVYNSSGIETAFLSGILHSFNDPNNPTFGIQQGYTCLVFNDNSNLKNSIILGNLLLQGVAVTKSGIPSYYTTDSLITAGANILYASGSCSYLMTDSLMKKPYRILVNSDSSRSVFFPERITNNGYTDIELHEIYTVALKALINKSLKPNNFSTYLLRNNTETNFTALGLQINDIENKEILFQNILMNSYRRLQSEKYTVSSDITEEFPSYSILYVNNFEFNDDNKLKTDIPYQEYIKTGTISNFDGEKIGKIRFICNVVQYGNKVINGFMIHIWLDSGENMACITAINSDLANRGDLLDGIYSLSVLTTDGFNSNYIFLCIQGGKSKIFMPNNNFNYSLTGEQVMIDSENSKSVFSNKNQIIRPKNNLLPLNYYYNVSKNSSFDKEKELLNYNFHTDLFCNYDEETETLSDKCGTVNLNITRLQVSNVLSYITLIATLFTSNGIIEYTSVHKVVASNNGTSQPGFEYNSRLITSASKNYDYLIKSSQKYYVTTIININGIRQVQIPAKIENIPFKLNYNNIKYTPIYYVKLNNLKLTSGQQNDTNEINYNEVPIYDINTNTIIGVRGSIFITNFNSITKLIDTTSFSFVKIYGRGTILFETNNSFTYTSNGAITNKNYKFEFKIIKGTGEYQYLTMSNTNYFMGIAEVNVLKGEDICRVYIPNQQSIFRMLNHGTSIQKFLKSVGNYSTKTLPTTNTLINTFYYKNIQSIDDPNKSFIQSTDNSSYLQKYSLFMNLYKTKNEFSNEELQITKYSIDNKLYIDPDALGYSYTDHYKIKFGNNSFFIIAYTTIVLNNFSNTNIELQPTYIRTIFISETDNLKDGSLKSGTYFSNIVSCSQNYEQNNSVQIKLSINDYNTNNDLNSGLRTMDVLYRA